MWFDRAAAAIFPGAESAGEAALKRLDQDVFAQPGVRTVIVLEGINDIQQTPHQLDPAKFMVICVCLLQLFDPVRKLSSVYTKLQSGAAAADRIFAGLDLRPRVGGNSRGPAMPEA